MIEALEDRRVAWLITDWGMGDDGFIASVRQSKRQSEVAAYRLDLTEYENHEDFIDSIKPAVGCNFYQLCEAISNAGKSWLMLDGFPSGEQSLLRDGNTLDADLEDFVDVVLEYCPETVILIRARRAPIQPRNPVVHLRPLDEGNHPL